MANWQRHLTLQPEWGQAKEHEIAVQELAAVISARLKALRPFPAGSDVEDGRLDLIQAFADLAADGTADTPEFDYLMARLYDWGDTRLDGLWNGKAACWIDTFTPAKETMTAPTAIKTATSA